MTTPIQTSPRVFPGLPATVATPRTRPLRICIASPEFIGPTRNGGIGTAYTALARALVARGHEVTCLYLEGKIVASQTIAHWVEQFRREGIKFVPLPQIDTPALDAPRHAAKSFEAYEWLKKNDHFDLVHFPEWQGCAYYSVSAKRQGLAFGRTTFCVSTHSMTAWLKAANREFLGDLQDLEQDFMERQSVAFADVVLSPSHYLLNWISDRGWVLPARHYVQQNILPQSARGTGKPDADTLREISELVFFGRLETRKGIVLFCDALDRLPATVHRKIKVVTFLGREATVAGAAARVYIEKRAQKWPWKIQIISDMDQPQAMTYLSRKGCLAVIPSLLENSPYTVLESLGAGIAFIASRVGGISELISPEDEGRVCFEPKPQPLAALLNAALDQGFHLARPAMDAVANEQAFIAWHESLPLLEEQPFSTAAPTALPKVSLCVTTFNRPKLLRQALTSISALDYPNFEVVLVDDGSTQPEALAFLNELEPDFAKRGWQIVRQQNLYLGAARNTAARHATGEYLLFMDDDNYAEPGEISTFVKAALNTGADIVTCGMNYFAGQEAPNRSVVPKGRWLPLGGAVTAGAFRNCFGDANSLVRRSTFESLGGFTEDYGVTHEDWEFHAKAVLKGCSLTVIPEFLFWYRTNPDSMIRTLAPHANYLRSIRPYVDAVPGALKDLVYFAQGQHLQLIQGGKTSLDSQEVRLTVAWRSKVEAARLFVQQKQPATAIGLLMDAVKIVEASDHAAVILQALLTIGGDLRALDRGRAEQILRLALQLATAVKNEAMQQLASNLIASLSGKPAAPSQPVVDVLASAITVTPTSAAIVAALPAIPAPLAALAAAPVVSVIIPVFNNLALTRACLDSIARTPAAVTFEIIMVDNASGDGTTEFLREQETAGRIRLITNPRNEGFSRACNQGAQAARGSLLLFLNNDTQVTPGWLDALADAAGRPNVGMVGAKLLYAIGSIQHAGITFINGLPDHRHRHAAADAPEVNEFLELDMVTGACLMIRRELILQLAGFDEAYRNGVEDIDLCIRARAAGWKVVYEPKAVVYHLEGQSVGRFDHVTENLKLFFERWGKSFDAQTKFIVPNPPKISAPRCSLLLGSAAPVNTTPVPNGKTISVAWEGTFLDFGSLSHVNRELTGQLARQPQLSLTRVGNGTLPDGSAAVPELQTLARSLQSQSPKDAQVVIRHAWPPNWTPVKGATLVVIQPWEYGALPAEWVAQSKNVRQFWVPSAHVREVYVRSGIPEAKVKIVPNGIDPERFRPGVTPLALDTKKTFKFLFVGGTIHRKGPDVLLQAWMQSFTAQDDVCLVIKDFGGKSCYAGQTLEQGIRAAQSQPNAPEILYLTDELPPESLPGLYAACDCLVHPYRGEGFGLPVLEAMACGLPVIVTGGGAADDFAPADLVYRISAQRRNLGRQISGMDLAGEGWLLEPSISETSAHLRHVFAHRDEARAKGRAASERVRRDWTWARAAQTALENLQALAAEPKSASAPTVTKKAAPIVLPQSALVGHLGEAREMFQRRKHREAWESTLAALAKRPFHPEAYLLLAEIAQAVGDSVSARHCAQHARRIAPEWKPAKQFLKGNLRGNTRHDWLVLPAPATQPEPAPAPRLSVCLITKNEEKFLGQCLASVRGLAAQIIVVDTGSTDRTVEIAKEHNAEVHQFTWCDDFSAARNVALAHATGDWVLQLDADEELLPEHRETIIKEIQAATVMAYRLPIIDIGREKEGCSYVPRLVRNAPGLFFLGRVHEQLLSSVEVRRQEWGLENRLGKAALLHHGYTAELVVSRDKIARNLRLLELAIEELPGEPNLVMSRGLELVRSGRMAEGLECYWEAVDLMSALPAAQVVPELRETLLTQLATHLLAAKQFARIAELLQKPLAKSSGGLTASQHFILGLAFMELKRPVESAEQMRQCLAKRSRPALSPVHLGILGVGPNHCLALSLVAMKETAGAEAAFRAALIEDPASRVVRFDFARFHAERGEPVEALKALHELVTAHPDDLPAWQFGGQLALSQPDFLEFACDWTGEALKHHAQQPAIILQRAEALMLSGNAEPALPLWIKAHSSKSARHLAAMVLCQAITGEATARFAPADEPLVSQEFLKWYRQLIRVGAHSLVNQINEKTGALRDAIPSFVTIWESAMEEAALPAVT